MQIKFVAVNPDGNICGPVGDTEGFVKQELARTFPDFKGNLWEKVADMGYCIKRARIFLMLDGPQPGK